MRNFFRNATGILAVSLLAAAGCQTWHPETGMTLPSPHYLDHPPQFLPQSPSFPLPNELESQMKAASQNANNSFGVPTPPGP